LNCFKNTTSKMINKVRGRKYRKIMEQKSSSQGGISELGYDVNELAEILKGVVKGE
jgi:hypothetical protein